MKDKFGYEYYQFIDVNRGLVDEPTTATKNDEVAKNTKEVNHKIPKNLPKVQPAVGAHLYRYCGPVFQKIYGKTRCVIDKYDVKTRACTEAKAVNNILYRAKDYCGVQPYTGGFFLDKKYLRIVDPEE